MDTNDITQTIPTIKAGDRVGEAYLNSLAHSINRRRGSVSPPSQKFTSSDRSASTFIVVKARADFTSIPIVTTTEDGVSCSTGDLVFNVHDGKVYNAKAAATWTVYAKAAAFVYISSGTDYGNLVYVRAASGSYFAISGSYA